MAEKAIYVLATLLAGATFVVTGGIQAAETAVKAEEHTAKPRPLGIEASIPFVDMGSIRDWHPDGTQAIYVQDLHGNWYHANLMGPCFDLDTSERVGFVTQGPDTLDKFASIVVRGQRCAFRDFVTSAPPPKKKADKAKPKG